MSKLTCLLAYILLFHFTIYGQIPVAQKNISPKLVLPSTLTGKVLLADSLKARKLTEGQILKTFLPEYRTEYQNELIDDLLVMYNCGSHSLSLLQAIKTEYPTINVDIVTKIIYSAFAKKNNKYVLWPWHLLDTINQVYTNNRSFQYLMKSSGKYIGEIFYYHKDGYYINRGNPDSTKIHRYRRVVYLSEFAKAGFEPRLILEATYAYYGSQINFDWWIQAFCAGMKLAAIPASNIATVLKSKGMTKEKIASELKKAGFTDAEVLEGLKAI